MTVQLLATRVHEKEGLVSIVEGELVVEQASAEEGRKNALRWLTAHLLEFCPGSPEDLLVVPFVELREGEVGRWHFAIHYQFFPHIALPDYRRIANEFNASWNSYVSPPVDEVVRNTEEQLSYHLRKLWDQEHNKDNEKEESLHAFAERVFGVRSPKELQQRLRYVAEQEARIQIEMSYERALGQALLDASPVEAPQVLVDYEMDLLLRSLAIHIPLASVLPWMAGTPLLKLAASLSSRNDLEERVRSEAKWRVSLRLLLSRIAAEERIKVDDEDIRALAAGLWGEDPATHNWPTVKLFLKDALLIARTFAFLKTC